MYIIYHPTIKLANLCAMRKQRILKHLISENTRSKIQRVQIVSLLGVRSLEGDFLLKTN